MQKEKGRGFNPSLFIFTLGRAFAYVLVEPFGCRQTKDWRLQQKYQQGTGQLRRSCFSCDTSQKETDFANGDLTKKPYLIRRFRETPERRSHLNL